MQSDIIKVKQKVWKIRLSIKIYNKILNCGNYPRKIYYSCKTHLENYLLRPIVSMINTLSYKLAKYLDTLIKPIDYCVKNNKVFLDKLSKYKIRRYRLL